MCFLTCLHTCECRSFKG